MRKLISVITPCLNEQGNVRNCRDAVKAVFETALAVYDYEHIFADNGSTDETRNILREMASDDIRVKIILNSRNFGAEASMLNALRRTRGDAVMVMIPADLQDPPDLIPEFVRHWERGIKVVYAVRRQRDENSLMTAIRKAFYRAVSTMSSVQIPENVGEFQLIDRTVVMALREFRERRPYLRGMIASCGFPSFAIEYDMKSRLHGRSNNNLFALLDQGLNGLISFSTVPLRLCMAFGLVIAGVSLAYAAVSFTLSLLFFRELAPPGIPTIIVALFFFGGIQLFFLGVMGEYISAIHTQVRGRPLVIEEETMNFDNG
jgi:glycosyltransferase involved in cell wall biosynthesis